MRAMNKTLGACGCVALLALLACKSKTGGTLTVDGAAFAIDTCRSGEANVPSFEGVDLLDSGGRRVRFLAKPDGKVRTFLFQPGAATGNHVGEDCGTISVTRKNSKVNNVSNIQGTVSANCTGGGHTIVAGLTFDNCH